jgi:hypothetical protein
MIVNGGSYRNIRWWADHLKAKENDRASIVKSYGLRSETIHGMLSEMEAVAQGTRCQNFFYQMNLNPLGDERLTKEQWDRAREIAEKHHGLEGQPYFVVEHVKHGRVHHHIVWSRIEIENMRAISDSKDARKNHAIAREVEQEFDLQRVTGPYDREPGTPRPKRAPEPWEMYRGMKTGLDPRDITAEVTGLFHQSDSGKAFHAALEQHGYMLVKGDRRGFVILDSAGKEHSLARRIEDVNTKELNAFMRDVDREALPTVEQGKAIHQERKIAGLEADRATVRNEIAWEEALDKAAIEKESTERRFVGREQGSWAEGRKNARRSPFEPASGPPHPQLNRTAPELWIDDVARETTRDARPQKVPEELRGSAAKIWTAYNRSADANAFVAALGEDGILLAAATKEEADRSHREAAFAKEIGRYAPVYREGEIVAVDERAQVYKLNQRTTGDDTAGVERSLKRLDGPLPGIDATKEMMYQRAEAREAYAQLMAIANPVQPVPRGRIDESDLLQSAAAKASRSATKGLDFAGEIVKSPLAPEIAAPIGKAARTVGKTLEGLGSAVEGLFAPQRTPEQELDGAIATGRREAEAERTIDFSRYTSEVAQARQQQEQERKAEQGRQKDHGRDR